MTLLERIEGFLGTHPTMVYTTRELARELDVTPKSISKASANYDLEGRGYVLRVSNNCSFIGHPEALAVKAAELASLPPKDKKTRTKKVEVQPIVPKEKLKFLQKEQEAKSAKDENRKLYGELEQAEASVRALSEALNIARVKDRVVVPPWVQTAEKGVTAMLIISDTHLDEVINPPEVNFVNEYNREIAKARLDQVFTNFDRLLSHHLKHFQYDCVVIPLLGDMLSGDIHDELRNTNEFSTYESLHFWPRYLAEHIRRLAAKYPQIDIPCVVGNHGRNTHKPLMKGRVVNNSDWFFYCLVGWALEDVPNVKMYISESADLLYNVYNTRFLFTHGDQFKGGTGIAGLLSPLMIGEARKRDRQQKLNAAHDYMVLGHFHERAFFKRVIVNGSLVGYNEYAYLRTLPMQDPQMSMLIVDRDRGDVTITAPVYAQ